MPTQVMETAEGTHLRLMFLCVPNVFLIFNVFLMCSYWIQGMETAKRRT